MLTPILWTTGASLVPFSAGASASGVFCAGVVSFFASGFDAQAARPSTRISARASAISFFISVLPSSVFNLIAEDSYAYEYRRQSMPVMPQKSCSAWM